MSDSLYPISEELSCYLIASGYERRESDPGYAKFIKGSTRIFFNMQGCLVEHYFEGEENERKPGWIYGGQCVGAWTLGMPLLQWSIILDAMGAVSIKENLAAVKVNVLKTAS